MDRSPLFAGPKSADPHPAGTVGVRLALAVPVKLHFHAPVGVGENFLAGRTHDGSGLNAADAGDLGDALRAEWQRHGDAVEVVVVLVRLVDFFVADGLPGIVLHAGDDELAIVGEMFGEIEGMARSEAGVAAVRLNQKAWQRLLLHADPDGSGVVGKNLLEVTQIGRAS